MSTVMWDDGAFKEKKVSDFKKQSSKYLAGEKMSVVRAPWAPRICVQYKKPPLLLLFLLCSSNHFHRPGVQTRKGKAFFSFGKWQNFPVENLKVYLKTLDTIGNCHRPVSHLVCLNI